MHGGLPRINTTLVLLETSGWRTSKILVRSIHSSSVDIVTKISSVHALHLARSLAYWHGRRCGLGEHMGSNVGMGRHGRRRTAGVDDTGAERGRAGGLTELASIGTVGEGAGLRGLVP